MNVDEWFGKRPVVASPRFLARGILCPSRIAEGGAASALSRVPREMRTKYNARHPQNKNKRKKRNKEHEKQTAHQPPLKTIERVPGQENVSRSLLGGDKTWGRTHACLA